MCCLGFKSYGDAKDGPKRLSARRLTPDEQRFIESRSGQVCLVSSVADVRLVVEGIKRPELSYKIAKL